MATKTISIDLEAYEKLVQARSAPNESFSRVIKRGEWKSSAKGATGLLDLILSHEPMDKTDLDRIDRGQKEDKPPKNRWK